MIQKPKYDRFALSAFFGVLGVALLLMGGHSYSIDEETNLATTRSLLNGRYFIDLTSVPREALVVAPGRDGRLTSFYGIGNALFSVPTYAVGKVASFLVASEWREMIIRLFYFSTNSFGLAFAALGFFRIAKNVGLESRRSFFISITMTFGTCLVSTARMGFAEPLTGLFLLWAFVEMTKSLSVRDENHRQTNLYLVGLFLGCAVMMRPSALIFVPVIGLCATVVSKDPWIRSSLRVAIGLSGPGLLIGLANLWRFGNVFETGYPKLPYTTPWYEGAVGQWLGSGKGLVWYAPLVLLFVVAIPRLWQQFRSVAVMSAVVVLSNTAIFSRFAIWSGDNAYGPRYLTIVLPFMLGVTIFALHLEFVGWRRLLAILGFGLNAGGNLVYLNAVYFKKLPAIVNHLGPSANSPAGGYDWDKVREAINFVPRFSQWKMHLELLPSAIASTWESAFDSKQAMPPFAGGVMQSLSWYSATIRLDTWWSHWLAAGGPLFTLSLTVPPILMIVWASLQLSVHKSERYDLEST